MVGSAKSGGDLGGDLVERQEMLIFLVGISRKGEKKKTVALHLRNSQSSGHHS